MTIKKKIKKIPTVKPMSRQIPHILFEDGDILHNGYVLDRDGVVKEPILIDVRERLYLERTLFLCREITTSFANHFIGLLLLLNSESDEYNDTDIYIYIYIYINSLGGNVHQSIAIYDVLKVILPEVSTIAMGSVASGASLIMAGGTITRWIAYPNARILIHQPRSAPTSTKKNIDSFTKKNIDSLIKETEDMLELRKTIADIYAQNIGKPVDVIQQDLERDYFMSATKARDYGIIDRIVMSKKENEIKLE